MAPRANKAELDTGSLQRFGKEFPQTIAEFHTLLTILKSFGVLAAYDQLEHSEITPEACLNRASRSLDLLAFHGDKWLFEDWFVPALERLRLRQGRVQFLLSRSIEEKTVARCFELRSAFPKVFFVKTYESTSMFRAVIIDDSNMLLGHYGYEVIEKDGRNAKGWKSPQLFIEDNHDWSLLIPFRELFRQAWDSALDLTPPVDPPSAAVVKREFHPA